MLIGVLLGIVIGLVIGPLLRSWLAWKEFVGASREARLHEEVLRFLARSGSGQAESEDSLPPARSG